MPLVSYSNASPYINTPQASWYMGHYQHRPIPTDPSDQLIIVDIKYRHRPDLLAFDLYGDVKFWWIFTVRNPNQIKDPIYDLTEGIQIYVPTTQRLENLLI